MKNLINFLSSNNLMVIATHDDHPWVAHVYYVSTDEPVIYVFGSPEVRWSRNLVANDKVGFSVLWVNSDDHLDRKGIQGVGLGEMVTDEDEINSAIEMYSDSIPSSDFSLEKVKEGEQKLFKIVPEYIKYWDDEQHGEQKVEIFQF